MMPLFLLLVTSAFCSELGLNTAYSGLRVSKNCKSIMKDNLKLIENTTFDSLVIADMSETQGEWVNEKKLTLKNFKVISYTKDLSKFKDTTCNVTSTGTFQAFNNKESFEMELSFAWDLEKMIGSDNGEGTVKMSTKKFSLEQNYYDNPSTIFFIDWKDPKVTYKSSPDEETAAWCLGLLEKNLGGNINLRMSERLKPIDAEIIKSYRQVTMNVGDKEPAVIAINTVNNPVGIKFKEEYYVVLNYKTFFKNSKYNYTTKHSLDTPFAKEDESFDFKYCFNSRFFGEFITFRSLFQAENEVFLNEIKLENYPTRVGFYKSIVPSLTNRYTDDKNVKINFKGDKEVSYPSNDKYKIPTKCTFTVEGATNPFLTLRTDYEVLHLPEKDPKKAKILLNQTTIVHFDTDPEVDYQARLIAMELANSLGDLINGYTAPKDEGLVVDNLRSEDYDFIQGEVNVDETCLWFKEKVKVSH